MIIQKVFKTGNSLVITIPKHLVNELKLKEGSEMIMELDPEEESLLVKKSLKSAANTSHLTPEFKQWLDEISTRHKKLIQELARR